MDERYKLVCKLLKDSGFEHEVTTTKTEEKGEIVAEVMKYRGDGSTDAITFKIGEDLKTIRRLFSKKKVYYMRFYFGRSTTIFFDIPCKKSVLDESIRKSGCKQCWTSGDVNDPYELYLCVPLQCHGHLKLIIDIFFMLWEIENPPEEEQILRETKEMREQLKKGCA